MTLASGRKRWDAITACIRVTSANVQKPRRLRIYDEFQRSLQRIERQGCGIHKQQSDDDHHLPVCILSSASAYRHHGRMWAAIADRQGKIADEQGISTHCG